MFMLAQKNDIDINLFMPGSKPGSILGYLALR
jgi:hypothetical protein